MNKTRPKKVAEPAASPLPPASKPRREPNWVAWSNDGNHQLARRETFKEARDAAIAMGEADPILEPVQIPGRLA